MWKKGVELTTADDLVTNVLKPNRGWFKVQLEVKTPKICVVYSLQEEKVNLSDSLGSILSRPAPPCITHVNYDNMSKVVGVPTEFSSIS